MKHGRTSRFGAMVRAYRHETGLTQRELAAKAGLSVAALRDIEQSRRGRPRPRTVAALSGALGLGAEQAADLASACGDAKTSLDESLTGSAPTLGRTSSGQGLWLAALGPLEAWHDGMPLSLGPPARRAVLGLLLTEPGVLIHRETIVDALWGEKPPSTAAGLAQAHVSRIRGTLGPLRCSANDSGVIDSVQTAYRLRLSDRELDLLLFRDLAKRAGDAAADGRLAMACDLYEQAVGLWRGEPLADVEMLRGHFKVVLLRQELSRVLLRYATAAFAMSDYQRVLPRLQSLAAAEPLNEPVHARLMIALAGSGYQAAAIRVYEDLRSRLDQELGLYPSGELTDAHVRVLRQDIPAACRQRPHSRAGAEADLTAPRQLPGATRCFMGREGELHTLSGLLESGAEGSGGVVIAALTGMAGIGKTALAVHWGRLVAGHFPDGQLFVDLRGASPSGMPVAPTEVLHGFLTALGVTAARVPVDAAGRAALFRSLLVGRRMLIVLDNARDAEQVRPLLPGSRGCLALVTSRNRLTGLAAAEHARLVVLGALPEEEARRMLAKGLGADRAAAEFTAVGELIALCARLPLALAGVAARAAARPHLPLAALAGEMRDTRRRLDVLETGETATSVRSVMSWSCARLSESARRLFRLLGTHAGPDIAVPAAASLAGLTRSQAYLALAELCDEHLLSEHRPGRYTCHDLLRAYAAEELAVQAVSEATETAHTAHTAHGAHVQPLTQHG